MSEWIETTIGDVATVFDGPHATPKKTETGPWFLSISSLDKGRLNLAESAHVTEDDFAKWTRRVTPQEGDVLFSYETRLGEAALMPEGIRACLGRRMGILRPKREAVDPMFLLYAYLGPEFQETIAARRIHGATVDRIPLVSLPTWPIRLPGLAGQRAVVAVLGALDNKIAVNEHITATARSLSHAKGMQVIRGVSGGTGLLGDYVEVTKGISYRSADLVPGGGYLVTLKCVDRTGVFKQRGLKPFSGIAKPTQVVKHGDVVVAQTDLTQQAEVLGRSTRIVDLTGRDRLAASLDLAVVRPRGLLTREYLDVLFNTREFREHALSYSNGTTVLHLGSRAVPGFTFALPDAATVTALTQVTRALFDVAVQAERETAVLAALRDTLLPQLMSGRLRVKDAEKIVEDHV